MPVLSLITYIPLVGMIVVMFLPKDRHGLIKGVATAFTLPSLALSAYILFAYNWASGTIQFVERMSWIPSLGISYHFGADGISVPMIALTALLSTISIIVSYNITNRLKEYFAFFLMLEVGMLGVFCALDFFLFYIFWEVMLVPMYFLIGIWGGPRREYAAMKFFLYTLFGSVIMLVGILALYFSSEPRTLDLLEHASRANAGVLDPRTQLWIYAAFFIGFAIKVPVFPFHTWLPDAHVEAPTAVSVILAGVLLKMGTYGLIRISYPLAPHGAVYFALPLAILAMINIVYGAFISIAQKDLKKLVAYSSVSHMGFALLGLAALSVVGINACIFTMVSHGLLTGAMFVLVGVLYDRAHTREIAAFGGLGSKLPVFTAFMVFFGLGSLGLPGLSNFVAEFMAFLGAFGSWMPKWIIYVSISGVVLAAVYILRMIQNMFLGPFNEKWAGLTEINAREIITVAPLAALTVLIGFYPKPLINLMTGSVDAVVRLLPM